MHFMEETSEAERLNNLPNVTQLVNGKARIYIQVGVTQRLSNPGVYQNSLQDMVKHRLLGLSFIVSDSEGIE